MGGIFGSILGRVLGKAVEEGGEITRAVIAARLREAADEVERKDLVSDEDIDALKSSTDKIRDLQGR